MPVTRSQTGYSQWNPPLKILVTLAGPDAPLTHHSSDDRLRRFSPHR